MVKRFIPKFNKELDCLVDIANSLRQQTELMQKIIKTKNKTASNEYNINALLNLLIKKELISFKEFREQIKDLR